MPPIDPNGYIENWNSAKAVRDYLANQYQGTTFANPRVIKLAMDAGTAYRIDATLPGGKIVEFFMAQGESISLIRSRVMQLVQEIQEGSPL